MTDLYRPEFPVHPGRKIRSSPNGRHQQGTTVLVITQDDERYWYVEAASFTADGFGKPRTVFQGKTPGEISAWMDGNRWNPGGPIARPAA